MGEPYQVSECYLGEFHGIVHCRAGRRRKGAKMKVVALVSGGKDSCYAMQRCIDYGHEVSPLHQ
jgi:hypothetical protein